MKLGEAIKKLDLEKMEEIKDKAIENGLIKS